MKKSTIALLISSTLFLSACNDEQLTQKLLEAEKKIVQLEADYQKSQTQLTQKEAELAQLAKAKAESDKIPPAFPTLQPEIVEVFNKSSVVKLKKDPNNEYAREETPIAIFVSTAKTGIDWIDNLLLLNLFETQYFSEFLPKQKSNDLFASLQESLNTFYQEQEEMAKDDGDVNKLDYLFTTYYVGQRKHIVTFEQTKYYYTGGAHGMYTTEYLNLDTNKKSLITLNDLVSPENKEKLRKLLWEEYVRDENRDTDFTNEKDFFVAEQFYFTPEGIKFVYPLYSLAAYSEGEVQLLANFVDVNHLLNPEYQLTKKDGFGWNQNQ